MKTMSRLQFFQRVARHRTPQIAPEVEHTWASMNRRWRVSAEAVAVIAGALAGAASALVMVQLVK
jgi:hypothetical protein